MFKNFAVYLDKRIISILFLGFSSGLPLLLLFSTLSFWLKDAGVPIELIGFFSLVRTPYSFKFLWSPLIDRYKIPYFSKVMGRRRSWVLLTQILLMFSIWGMACSNPNSSLYVMGCFAFLVAFFSSSQDIVIDAYRIEILEETEQGAGSAMVVLGYRIAMLFSGAGALYLASFFSWQVVYMVMGCAVLVGIITILLIKEPKYEEKGESISQKEDFLIAIFRKSIVEPLKDFMQRPKAIWILAFIMVYKLCDTYMGIMANPFYVEVGFSKETIAKIIQVYGMGATITGGILGGVFVKKYGIMNSLFVGAILQALSNLMYAAQAVVGNDERFLVLTITVENISGGLGTTAFVAYMSSLCSIAYTATQYALLSSIMAFARDILASTSGKVAFLLGWTNFFIVTSFMAIPSLLLLIIIKKYPIKNKE
ncbi:MAG: AmpG family muropeptide MFS transporter [Alphaproteobacteria bacterium]